MDSLSAITSTRPYLIRAMHEWCSDNGFTPYISVFVDKNTLVPIEHVKDNEIILNISIDATSGLQIGNEFINFKSRFSGVVRDLMIPINNVQAIFAKENGQG
ncbi:MAG TPA: ClpXP protease specificity-enhancing factor, partial [Burkholderiaceae bacterium]|nr:ClpXP protease specificity-enhancing factor [Burkholderiaceae bacterium]